MPVAAAPDRALYSSVDTNLMNYFCNHEAPGAITTM
jgi:hypothetical protein